MGGSETRPSLSVLIHDISRRQVYVQRCIAKRITLNGAYRRTRLFVKRLETAFQDSRIPKSGTWVHKGNLATTCWISYSDSSTFPGAPGPFVVQEPIVRKPVERVDEGRNHSKCGERRRQPQFPQCAMPWTPGHARQDRTEHSHRGAQRDRYEPGPFVHDQACLSGSASR
jgi:hypothetical protein